MTTKQSTRQARGRRRRARGAAMIEAVVAIPFFIIIFAAAMFIGKIYTSKFATLRQARSQAWQAAVQGCGDDTKVYAGSIGDEKPDAVKFKSPRRDVSGTPAAKVAYKEFGEATGTSDTVDVAAPNVLGGKTKKISSTVTAPCNERVREDSVLSTLSYLWDLVTSGAQDEKNQAQAAADAKARAAQQPIGSDKKTSKVKK